MKYLRDDVGSFDADDADDALGSTVKLEQQIDAYQRQLETLPQDHSPVDKADIELKMAAVMVDLGRGGEAWDLARAAFDVFIDAEDWENAVIATNVLFQSEQEDSLAALGQGIWLAVTFPVNPELTVAVLQHVVDETPDDSDGAAVAAATAHYVASIRSEGRKRDDLLFFANNLLGVVARRHSNVDTQEQFEFWFEKLELHDPALFLPRLRNVVDVLVQDGWWFDRETLSERLPVN